MLNKTIITHRWLILAGEWVLLFLVILIAIWTVTQNALAPQLILLALLTIITINFSLPPEQSSVGLVPLVAVSSLLALGLNTAVSLTIASFILAELTAPLWNSFWEQAGSQRPSRLQRLATALIHITPLWIAGTIYQRVGGTAPLVADQTNQLSQLAWLAGSFGLFHWGLACLWWLLQKRPFIQFLRDNALSVLMSGLFAQPMAILGGITFTLLGLPIFVVFCIAVMIFSLVIWLSWQRRYVAEQQYTQFALLNNASSSLRETLDLTAVLQNTHHLVTELIPTNSFTITLLQDNVWQRPFPTLAATPTTYQPDDFTRWVAAQERTLHVEARDLHFASHHQLTPPTPTPYAWLGTPLTAANQVVGVMVLQRFEEQQPFGRWHRELLLAIAGQASAAIQNARLYSETLRLYNLTDEALAQRVKQLQALLDSIQEGVLMLNTQGHIALINPFAASLLERQPDQLVHSRLDTAVAATIGYQADSLTHLLGQLSQGTILEPAKAQFYHHNRVIVRLETPVLATNHQVIGWLMLFRDVTEEHQLAEQRADLTRMIIHDLRNPISTLISTLNLAQTQLNSTMDTAVLIDAQQSCLDMLDMVDSLMDITRLEAGQMAIETEAIYLQPLAQKVVARLQPLATQRNISLSLTCAADLPAVWADEEMIRRVLINLLDNALKFTPADGRIHSHLQPEPAVSPQHELGLRCTITDTGPGIPPEHRKQVFNRFMRTNAGGAQVRGTGLGLAFCKMAIEAHNGRIWVESANTGGSQFIFTLPGVPIVVEEGLEPG